MKVLMTGHKGYIGSLMATVFQSAGHSVVGLDRAVLHSWLPLITEFQP